MKKTAHGTLFAVPLPDGTFLSGRVMLDIYACLKRRLFPADSPLPGLGKAYLIEMYSAVTEQAEHVPSNILIRGAFVESDEVGKSWPIIGHKPINPHEVEFPESILVFMHAGGQLAFECGELRIPLPLDYYTADRIKQLKCRHSAFLWPFTCLRMLDRENEVPKDYKMASLVGADLRNSPYRAMVYEHLPFTTEMSYFEKQQSMGLDLCRLYVDP